jgi:hypothetical protein
MLSTATVITAVRREIQKFDIYDQSPEDGPFVGALTIPELHWPLPLPSCSTAIGISDSKQSNDIFGPHKVHAYCYFDIFGIVIRAYSFAPSLFSQTWYSGRSNAVPDYKVLFHSIRI